MWPSNSTPLPFPTVQRMVASQQQAVAKVAATAGAKSAAATAMLLAHLNSSAFRRQLTECCSESGLAAASALELLAHLRAMVDASELVHNFDGTWETDATIEIGLNNATSYFPSTWELRYLDYYGPRGNKLWGYPRSPEGVGEEGIFQLPRFAGLFDTPLNFASASARLLYIALNLLRADVGNPGFGNVTAVFAPSFWKDSVIASPVDTGLYTMRCNDTYRKEPNASDIGDIPLACAAGDISPGVYGALDHVIYNNMAFWQPQTHIDTLARAFARSFGDAAAALTNISSDELSMYIE